MQGEASSAGFYSSKLWQKDYPKLQIMTIEELIAGSSVEMPPVHLSIKQAERVQEEQGKQKKLFS